MPPTRVHIDLVNIRIKKPDINKLAFGLCKYVQGKRYAAPFIYTATSKSKDTSYLGVLKNNNILVVDTPPSKESIDVYVSPETGWGDQSIRQLLMVTNMPSFSSGGLPVSRMCIYIDWDNIQVAVEYIPMLINGIAEFVESVKTHDKYVTYAFLRSYTSTKVKEALRRLGVNIITTVNDKPCSGDGEMIRFIQSNVKSGDSLCIASGDRDFSPTMVDYARLAYNVFLVYNKQAMFTFKHNRHWLSSINVKNIKGVGTRANKPQKVKLFSTKPCKFYNMSTCRSIRCKFLHMCGVCGREHKAQDMHHGNVFIKNNICKKYNDGTCPYNRLDCTGLHVCAKCKKPHPYYECSVSSMFCPLCNYVTSDTSNYIKHMLSDRHTSRIEKIRTISKPMSNIVLVM
jgi:hypothetical protein